MGGKLGKTILVVDDDFAIQEAVKGILEDEGYDVIVADDGLRAFEILADVTPTVIILDLMMPRMDGFTFVNELDRRELRGQAPVMVMTAAGRARAMVEHMQVDGYLEKPFTMQALLNEVARLADSV